MMSNVRQTIEDAKRLRVIVSTLFDAGFSSYVDAAKLRYMVSLRSRLRRPFLAAGERERLERPVPMRVREAFERLGPTFVKFGQMLSLRSDLVGADYAAEFSKLQEDAPRIPWVEIEKVIADELGKPIAKAFVKFNKIPIAAASLAQVYRAELSGHRVAAVKVERPGIRKIIERDIHLMLLLAHLVERSVTPLGRYRPVAIVKEFADWTMRELDFSIEGANIDRFRNNFADVPEVKFPEVYWTHTKKRILTMEYFPGRSFNDLVRLRSAEGRATRRRAAEIMLKALFKMYLVHGFFQADPHPGNFRLLKDGRLAFIDLGMVGYLTSELRTELLSCFLSYTNRDSESYARHLLELSERGPEADPAAMKREVIGVLDSMIYRPTFQKGAIRSFAKVLDLGVRHDIHFPSDLALFARSIAASEGTACRLSSEVDIDALFKPFVDEIIKGNIEPGRFVRSFSSNAFDYLAFLRELPVRTMNLMRQAESGEFGVKLNLRELYDLKEEFDRENDIRVVAIVAAALFVGAAILLQIRAESVLFGVPVAELALLTSFALFFWTALQVLHRPRA
jgi:ubiquinone biosynthesis protein